MDMSRSAQAWEGFWKEVPTAAGEVFWDAPPEVTAARHLPLFSGHFDAALPLVDLGCGNGTQTRWLAGRYHRVHGIDISATAIDRADAADGPGAATYERLDATDADALRRLHGELGDANVYLRGVLHQSPAVERPALVAGVAALAGRLGRVFMVELAPAVTGMVQQLAARPEGLPEKMRPVLRHGITPGEMTDEEVPRLCAEAGLAVLDQGAMPLVTTERTPAGAWLELPSKWLVAGHSGGLRAV